MKSNENQSAPISGPNDLAHRQDGRTQDVEIGEKLPRPSCSVQRLVLPDLATFREWFYGTEAMNHADNDVYVTAKNLIPELYALLQSKAEGVGQ
jgi:hypothetical protein